MLRKIKENPFYFATLILASFPILPLKIKVFVIAIWLISAIYEHISFKTIKSKANLKWFVAFISLFVFYLLSTVVYQSSNNVFSKIETKAALLVIPLGFYLMRKPFTKEQLKNIIRVYQLACLAMALYIIILIIPKLITNWSLLTIETFNYTFRFLTEKISGVHPTYLSIMFLLSIYLEINFFLRDKKEPKYKNSILSILHLTSLTLIIILLAARAPIISFLIILIFFAFLKSIKKGLIILIGSISTFLLVLFFVPFIGNRFTEILEAKSIEETTSLPSSTSIRKSIHECSSSLIKEHWIFGVGIGEKQDLLNECYSKFNNEELSSKNYNTHNQYFDIILTLGVIGLILFLAMILYPLSFKSILLFKPLLFFKLFIILCFLTENILSRQDGVVFFAFFNCLLTHYYWWQFKVKQKNQFVI